MKRGAFIAGVLLVALGLNQTASAEDAKATGERLLQKFWDTLESDDPNAEAKLYSPAFQSVHQDGAWNAEQTIKFITDLKLSAYKLSDIKISEEGPVIVASYFVTAAETLGGKRLPSRKAARMTVFLKSGQGWKVVAHANLNPLN